MINSPLGPQPTSPSPATPLSGARAAILDVLRGKEGPSTVEALAREMGQHPNTVREHLEALVGAGLAELADGPLLGEVRPARRGRPSKRYRAVEQAGGSLGYAELAGALAAELARLAPDPRAAGAEAGRGWARQALGPAPVRVTASDARRRVLAELVELGFGIEAVPSRTRRADTGAPGGSGGEASTCGEADTGLPANTASGSDTEVEAEAAATVRLVRCPLLSAAKDQPGVVCSVHAGLVEESLRLLGHDDLGSRLEPFAEPGACLLTIGRP
ncbi:helix-turn-helix domain-containing protein [Sinomonas sp. ASV486]|uniref:helix-turn-helix domain-containing protein n=1 Tax=Sinomonas sp. ASV486 TaxID=3051170 RepID=UPI0027DD7656|nr:helix-turn-helix domain-containing protein [Sinomonas sp. ASV486]MDQ4490486.1 helix-turn-helix domain-containing protein [Sinomonas sp. ASV486]